MSGHGRAADLLEVRDPVWGEAKGARAPQTPAEEALAGKGTGPVRLMTSWPSMYSMEPSSLPMEKVTFAGALLGMLIFPARLRTARRSFDTGMVLFS